MIRFMTKRGDGSARDAGGHGVGASRVRQFRCSDELWTRAGAKATEDGETVSDVIRRLLLDYVGDPGVRGLEISDMDYRSTDAQRERINRGD